MKYLHFIKISFCTSENTAIDECIMRVIKHTKIKLQYQLFVLNGRGWDLGERGREKNSTIQALLRIEKELLITKAFRNNITTSIHHMPVSLC